jgi:hypothetical protein
LAAWRSKNSWASKEKDRALEAEAEATDQRNRAVAAEGEAKQQRDEALTQQRRADEQAAIARPVHKFLQDDLLRRANPGKLREDHQPDDWTTFNAQSMLGCALLGQKNYPEAEPLLKGGYEAMQQREAKIHPQGRSRLTEALERLVPLYEAWGKKDEAAKWRKKLEDHSQSKPTNANKAKS